MASTPNEIGRLFPRFYQSFVVCFALLFYNCAGRCPESQRKDSGRRDHGDHEVGCSRHALLSRGGRKFTRLHFLRRVLQMRTGLQPWPLPSALPHDGELGASYLALNKLANLSWRGGIHASFCFLVAFAQGNVQGSYVRGCGIHHTFNRAVTIHGVRQFEVMQTIRLSIIGV